jgi:large subunit ribosomal protein L18
MINKVEKVLPRQRRCRLTRSKIAGQEERMRLTVHKSSQHIYAQIFTPDGAQVLACASSVEKDMKAKDFGQGKIKLSEAIGNLVAERAKAKGIVKVAFDRSGYKYHGCIKALADGARAGGLEF